MQADKTAIERAFDLARSGKFKTVLAIRRELSREGYSTIQIAGPILMRQLRDAMKVVLGDGSEQQ